VRYYFDTSALVRYYHAEPGSPEVEAIIQEAGATHVLSWLTVLETQSAFALKVRTGDITDSDFLLLLKRLKTDIAQRRLLVTRVLRRHFDRAERLLAKHAMQLRLRSLDALHLGIGLDLQDHGHVDTLVTTDITLASVAAQEGLTVRNPLSP
jgi:predicted nucleic acid-binding protein